MSERTTYNEPTKIDRETEEAERRWKENVHMRNGWIQFWYMYVRAYIANYVCEKLRTTKRCATILNYLITKYRFVVVVEHQTHIAVVVVVHMCSPTLVRCKAMSAIHTHMSLSTRTHLPICVADRRRDSLSFDRMQSVQPTRTYRHRCI